MPFKSERQRKWMWANEPEMARRWEEEEEELKRRGKRKEGKAPWKRKRRKR